MVEPLTAYRTCPLCEATCGLELTLEGRTLTRVRGDRDDVFSGGYVCPKAFALIDLERDPDVVRRPLIREGEEFREASWDEAFELIEAKLRPIMAESGPDSVAIYLGNPNVHNLAGSSTTQSWCEPWGRPTCTRRPAWIRCRSRCRAPTCSAPGSPSPSPTWIEPTTC